MLLNLLRVSQFSARLLRQQESDSLLFLQAERKCRRLTSANAQYPVLSPVAARILHVDDVFLLVYDTGLDSKRLRVLPKVFDQAAGTIHLLENIIDVLHRIVNCQLGAKLPPCLR